MKYRVYFNILFTDVYFKNKRNIKHQPVKSKKITYLEVEDTKSRYSMGKAKVILEAIDKENPEDLYIKYADLKDKPKNLFFPYTMIGVAGEIKINILCAETIK